MDEITHLCSRGTESQQHLCYKKHATICAIETFGSFMSLMLFKHISVFLFYCLWMGGSPSRLLVYLLVLSSFCTRKYRRWQNLACGMAMSRVPQTPLHLLEHCRVDKAHRSLNWRLGVPAEMEFAALQVQLDDHPSHKIIANCSSSLQCNWFLIRNPGRICSATATLKFCRLMFKCNAVSIDL